jgi:glycosyltransferase involved in cell wall biosynthesis
VKDSSLTRKKMAVVVAVPEQVRYFLVNHVINFSKQYDVSIISNLSVNRELLNIFSGDIKKYHMPILREINIVSDIKALFKLTRHFYREKYSVIYSVSPKAGLLAMIAAWLVGVPVRIHTFTGQVWLSKNGFMRVLLKLMDRITSMLATVVLVDSQSQREFLIKNYIVSKGKSTVLHNGSISGVDTERFCLRPELRKVVRDRMGATDKTIVYLYVGRLKRDKGILELVEAFLNISKNTPHIALWLVGPDEDELQGEIKSITAGCDQLVHLIPYTTTPEEYMLSSDIFCLPSHREGFGSTIIEAAACGVPAIGTRIYGITDAIVDGETGVLVEKGNIDELAHAMGDLANDAQRLKRLGESAHQRALEQFNQQMISDELLQLIEKNVANA